MSTLLAAATTPLTFAQQFSPEYLSCHARAKNLVQEGVCDQSELGKQDDRLNKAYKQLMSQYASDPARQASLRTEERTWLKKRDYNCKINGTTIDGGCLMTQTAQRADTLEKQIKF
ncbi:MAG: lysozyme inhibitor LprI family protein [Janthinobacterium lividum]